jgi:folate-binding protein YgfZ
MPVTPLSDRLTENRIPLGEYCGVETARSFGDSRAEFAALGRGAAVYDLGWRAHFSVGGADRVRWLNGMVSNNIRDLPAGHGNYNFLLNAHGHIQGDLYICNRGDDLLAATDRAQLDKVLQLLRKYIIMDQVEIAEVPGLTALGIQGPQAGQVLDKAGFQGPRPQPTEWSEVSCGSQHGLLVRRGPERFLGYELWMPAADAPALWDTLVAAGATRAGAEALEMFRVAAGIPRCGVDIRDRDLPQETGQMQALNFSKGCYLGQEIVERIRSRGGVRRTFTGLALEGAIPSPTLPGGPEQGGAPAKIQAEGREVGEITSVAVIPLPTPGGPGPDRVVALGYLRREFAKPGATVQVNGVAGVVTPLPFTLAF